MTRGLGVLAACMLAGSAQAGRAGDDIQREGVGSRRTELNALELKPFPVDLWSELTDWQNGGPIGPAETDGKVVLIMTFAAYNPTSKRVLPRVQSLYDAEASSGLVVVGAHNEKVWSRAPAVLTEYGVTFPCAHDATGGLYRGLMVDQDPDFYVIDRAGNLRFADIVTDDVEEAVALLLAESRDDAANLPGRLKEQARALETEASRSVSLGSDALKPGLRLEVEFPEPDESAYDAAKWPAFVGEAGFDRFSEQTDLKSMTLDLDQSEENWFPARPTSKGRLLIAYIFDPRQPKTLGIIDTMERVQRHNYPDVDVVGMAFNLRVDGNDMRNIQDEDYGKLVERNRTAIRELLRSRRINHPLLAAPPRIDNWGGSEMPLFRTRPDNISAMVILSTDGRVRYLGHPDFDNFRAMLPRILEADPAVRARRAAEEDERDFRRR